VGLFNRLFERGRKTAATPRVKRYQFPTGNIELAIRVQNGEPLFEVLKEIKQKWTPGNECLWDDYDAESLIDSDEKRYYAVNCLLYARVTIYRALRGKGKDIRGTDPFAYVEESQDSEFFKLSLPPYLPGRGESCRSQRWRRYDE